MNQRVESETARNDELTDQNFIESSIGLEGSVVRRQTSITITNYDSEIPLNKQ
jgi:hypothetical protein